MMRSEQEMFDLILNTAREDERIRAVMMNGSRANPNAPRDFFQDFDIVYFVTDHRPFRHNFEWIKRFGEMMILQLPDDMGDSPHPEDASFAYLMQFSDGNRIDLTIYPIAKLSEWEEDRLSSCWIRTASFLLTPRRAIVIICPNRRPPSSSSTAPMNSGGAVPT
jgi:aminoglycoside 6-adenylyltransferase